MNKETKEQDKWYKAGWEDCKKEIIENFEGIKAMDRKMLSIDEVINLIKQ